MTKVTRIAWDEEVEKLSEKIKSFIALDVVKEKVITGEWKLFEILSEEQRLGVFITRIAVNYDGTRELVVMFTMSQPGLTDRLSPVLLPVYEEVARLEGLDAVRMHIVHKPIEEFIIQRGYELLEKIYIKKVK